MMVLFSFAILAPFGNVLRDYLRGKYGADSWILPIEIRTPFIDVSTTAGYLVNYAIIVIFAVCGYIIWMTIGVTSLGLCLFLVACSKDLRSIISEIGER